MNWLVRISKKPPSKALLDAWIQSMASPEHAASAAKTLSRLWDESPKSIAIASAWAKLVFSVSDNELRKDWQKSCLQKIHSGMEREWLGQYADCLINLGALDEAEMLCEKLYSEHPEFYRGLLGLARIALMKKRWADAVMLWDSLMRAHPDRVTRHWFRASMRALIMDGQLDKAKVSERAFHHSEESKKYFALLDQLHQGDVGLKFNYAFIITYGRSGSTLLQGLLNGVDGMLIRGENGQLFHRFYESWRDLGELIQKSPASTLPNNPWYGACLIDRNKYLRDLEQVARNLILGDLQDHPGIRCIGFKEIRYSDHPETLADYLEFMNQLFPKAAFIFNTRKLDDVVDSGFWKEEDPEITRKKLLKTESIFSEFAESHGNCYSLTYEDILARNEKLKGMYDFLGAPYDTERVDIIMSTPHSYAPTKEESVKLFDQF